VDHDGEEAAIAAAHDELCRAGLIAPVTLGSADERLWVDCDLASFAENRLGEQVDPARLDDDRRADLLARATTERLFTPSQRKWERCFWLRADGVRAGTVALWTTTHGNRLVYLSSLYVFPSHRGRGVGRGAVAAVHAALARRGFGIRLDTSWTWQPAVRVYLALGMRLYMWKRDLTFHWGPRDPPYSLAIGETEASMTVHAADENVLVGRATRDGDRLVLDDVRHDAGRHRDLVWGADSTFVLALALAGWPLVRSAEAWEQSYFADGGAPEALAYKITIWEAWHHKQGWRVATPRIPGLEYPTWSELEASWG
jgi:GNAT superfamily N-acetyltransferase